MPLANSWKGIAARIVYILAVTSFFTGLVLTHKQHFMIAQPFVTFGNWVLAAMLYLFIIYIVIDFARIINSFTFKAEWLTFKYIAEDNKAYFFSLISGIVCCLILIIGYFNAQYPIRKEITLKTEKSISRGFKFILVSDIHMGMMNKDKYLNTLVNRINNENADFVIIAGDFFDGDPTPVLQTNADKILQTIKTNFGVYAVTGNHDYMGNVNLACKFLNENGVTVLQDSVLTLPLGVSLIGRQDGHFRKNLKDLMQNINNQLFLINIIHQPYHLEESEQNNIDLQLSGHTHHGQLWPINFLTKKIYENSFGLIKKSSTYIYVSSGYGTWGPPIRTTCHPEMVVFNIEN
ncbi:MAG: metallophosphoesterase [Bacteroidales bacterium]|nr:metallophosphoesterase [Bacteroidales bacterium]